MKALLLGTIACLMIATGFAAPNLGDNPPVTNLVTTTSFSVKVTSGSTALDGATVTVKQNGVVISSGTTMRGKAQVYVENGDKFTLEVVAAGHKAYSKEVASVTQSEVISVALVPLVGTSKGVVKPKK